MTKYIPFDVSRVRDVERAANHHDHIEIAAFLDTDDAVKRFPMIDPTGRATDMVLYVLPCAVTLQVYKLGDKQSCGSWDMGGPDCSAQLADIRRDHGDDVAVACVVLERIALFPEMMFCPDSRMTITEKENGLLAMAKDYMEGTHKYKANWDMISGALDTMRNSSLGDPGITAETLCQLIIDKKGSL